MRRGELFAVHVSLEAEAVDDRGGESAAQAFIQDPQKREPAAADRARPQAARQAALQGAAPQGAARGALPGRPSAPRRRRSQLSDAGFSANESSASPHGPRHPHRRVARQRQRDADRRTPGPRAPAVTSGRRSTTVRFADGDTSPRLVEIPLREDRQAEPAETFSVELRHARCAALGAGTAPRSRWSTTTRRAGAAAEPAFTIGGTVDGLSGSGLVLTNFGADLPVSANGRFTLPGTRPAGRPTTSRSGPSRATPTRSCTVAARPRHRVRAT